MGEMPMVMRVTICTALAALFIQFSPCSYAQTELIGKAEVRDLKWGGVEHGWSSIYMLNNVQLQRGPMGRLNIILDDASPIPDESTDLYLHFDDCRKNYVSMNTPNYRAGAVEIFPSEDIKKYGRSSAGFLRYSNRIEIKPLAESLFFSEKFLPSFTIDFFLYPVALHDGDSVLTWYAPTVDSGDAFSGFKAFFKNGKLHWKLDSVFYNQDGGPVQVLAAEMDRAPLNEWHHHALHYDSSTGMLVLYYDGKESSIRWLTKSGEEGGTLLRGRISPYLAPSITIGEKFLGYIDEFRISRGKAPFFLANYKLEGVVMSEVLDLENVGTKFVKIMWDSTEDNGTSIRLFLRMSNLYFLPASERLQKTGERVSPEYPGIVMAEASTHSAPEWVPVRSNTELRDRVLSGRYLQWKAVLYGTEGRYTPVLHAITVQIEPDPPPGAPILLEARPMSRGALIKWVKNTERDVVGYKVYYGNATKNYFGRGALLGDSPVFVAASVDAGDTEMLELKGLENERVYFISVTAVDSARQEGGFSRELIVRPSMIHE